MGEGLSNAAKPSGRHFLHNNRKKRVTHMIQFNSANDLLEFIEGLDGCGLILTDEEELLERFGEMVTSKGDAAGPNAAAFVIKFKDLLAVGTISDWIARAEAQRVNTRKLGKARQQLGIVRDFQARNANLCQLPD